MIRTAQIIARLRAECPLIASVEHSLSSVAEVDRPAAIISPTKVEAHPPAFYGQFSQILAQEFCVYILIDRVQDGGVGHAAADLLDDICASVRAALSGWTPDAQTAAPLAYAGGKLDRYQQQIGCWCEFFRTSNELRIA